MSFISRAYDDARDLLPVAELSTLCEVSDQLDLPTTPDLLRSMFSAPPIDPQRDLRLWTDAAGRLVGFAHLELRLDEHMTDGLLWFRVHPAARGDALEDSIIAWGDERLREAGRERGQPTRLYSGTNNNDAWRIATLERLGFTPIRYFLRMDRPLDAPIAEPQLPQGFTLRCADLPREAEAWVEMYNLAFVDHWNFHPLSVERLLHVLKEPTYRADLDTLAAAPDGVLAAFCACEINPEANARDGEQVAWVQVLGTRRGFRGLGLGRALLLDGLCRVRAEGMHVARLIVDANSLTGATRIYESVGFQTARTYTRYARD